MTMTSPSAAAAMNIKVSGKHVDVGDALRSRIADDLEATIGKVFDRGGSAEVVLSREGPSFCIDMVVVLASGQQLIVRALGGDAHAAFDAAKDRLAERLRRYKRRLKNHHPHLGGGGGAREAAAYAVLRAPTDDEDDEDEWGLDGSAAPGAPQGAIIAETQTQVKTMTVSMAVLELDLAEAPCVLFRHAGHGGLSVVYRRADGNIGWIDPERSRSKPVAANA